MKLLLDTHVLLWTLLDSPILSEKARELILHTENQVYFSILSLWEIQLKHDLHPDLMPINARQFQEFCLESGFILLPLETESIFSLARLARPKEAKRHKDPFDRLLICQAISKNMLFLTHDSLLLDYSEPCVCLI